MALVDIIISLYNKENTILRAIRSIQEQTFENWNIIVVDDGSTDNSYDLVEQIKDERITVIQQENQGPGSARNTGIKNSDAKYIAFLDADDEWLNDYLEKAVDKLEKEDISFVCCMYHEYPQKINVPKRWEKRGVIPGLYCLKGNENPIFTDWLLSFIHTDTTVFKRGILLKYDGFYEKDKCMHGEDTILFLRSGINEPFIISPNISVIHHREDSSLSYKVQFPLPPFLVNPNIIMDYCNEENKLLLSKAINHLALRHAQLRARNGHKQDAIDIIRRFPNSKIFFKDYLVCKITIFFSRMMPFWVNFKCIVGPKLRNIFK